MADFDKSWVGWQFSVTPEAVVDRLADPLGGIALVETGVNIHPTLHAVSDQASVIIRKEFEERNKERSPKPDFNPRSEAYHHWSGSSLSPYIRGATSRLRELCVVAREIRKPINDQLRPNNVYPPIKDTQPRIVASRRSSSTPNHVDGADVSTLWFGATKPGLQILHNGEWIPIDDVPSGHAFIWRGDSAYNGTSFLDPTRHNPVYRSMTRRVVALA